MMHNDIKLLYKANGTDCGIQFMIKKNQNRSSREKSILFFVESDSNDICCPMFKIVCLK